MKMKPIKIAIIANMIAALFNVSLGFIQLFFMYNFEGAMTNIMLGVMSIIVTTILTIYTSRVNFRR